nr:DUF285 domain-containing protein [Treponema sp.]
FCTKVPDNLPETIPEDFEDWYDFSEMFMDCYSLESIEFAENFDTRTVSTMKSMFENTGALESIDLSHFNTSNVTNMSCMFAGSGLTELELSSFNTSKVTAMSSIFTQSYLETITFGENFDVSHVTNMSLMFAETYLVNLDLSAFDTSAVTNMDSMFAGMYELTEIDLSGDTFVVTNVTTVNDMFCDCSNLNKVYVNTGTNWFGTVGETSTTRTGAGMFTGCDSLVGGSGAVFDDAAVGISMANTTTSGYFTAR